MTGYLVARGSSYLEWNPSRDVLTWLAPFPEYAAVFTQERATWLAEMFHGAVIVDPLHREPEFGEGAAGVGSLDRDSAVPPGRLRGQPLSPMSET